MVQSWRFGEYRVPFHCHQSPISPELGVPFQISSKGQIKLVSLVWYKTPDGEAHYHYSLVYFDPKLLYMLWSHLWVK